MLQEVSIYPYIQNCLYNRAT